MAKPGRKYVPGDVTIITRVEKARPGVYFRIRWPFWEEMGWRRGQRLAWDLYNLDEPDTEIEWLAWIGPPDKGQKGYTLHRPYPKSPDLRLIFPLRPDMPYLPAATAVQGIDVIERDERGACVCFLLGEGPYRLVRDIRRLAERED